MAPAIIDGLVNYVSSNLAISVWDGEVPRQATNATDIVIPVRNAPVVRVEMTEAGVTRSWTFEDAYGDEGTAVTFDIWDTTRLKVEDMIGQIEALLANSTNWPDIDVGSANGFFVYNLLLRNWTCRQDEGTRTEDGELVYYGRMIYEIGVHGAVATR